MADIHIVREHGLGLEHARRLAWRWAEVAEKKLEMECGYEEGESSDLLRFKRPGARGELKVTAQRFELAAHLGLLLGVFKGRIETEIVRNLDELLAHPDPLHAFETGLAHHESRRAAKAAAKPHKPVGGKPTKAKKA